MLFTVSILDLIKSSTRFLASLIWDFPCWSIDLKTFLIARYYLASLTPKLTGTDIGMQIEFGKQKIVLLSSLST